MPAVPQRTPAVASRHHLQWKGVTSGPYSDVEIRELLARGEISLMHRVENNGCWQSVSEYLSSMDPPGEMPLLPGSMPHTLTPPDGCVMDATAELEQLDRLVLTGYILCGATAVLPVLATLPALWVASRLYAQGVREAARLQYILAATFTLLGLLVMAILLGNG